MNKYRSGTQMHLMDEKCHDDNGEDDDVSNDNDDDELMMMMVMMIDDKDKLRFTAELRTDFNVVL